MALDRNDPDLLLGLVDQELARIRASRIPPWTTREDVRHEALCRVLEHAPSWLAQPTRTSRRGQLVSLVRNALRRVLEARVGRRPVLDRALVDASTLEAPSLDGTPEEALLAREAEGEVGPRLARVLRALTPSERVAVIALDQPALLRQEHLDAAVAKPQGRRPARRASDVLALLLAPPPKGLARPALAGWAIYDPRPLGEVPAGDLDRLGEALSRQARRARERAARDGDRLSA